MRPQPDLPRFESSRHALTITNFYTSVHFPGFNGMDMLHGITSRLPAVLVNAMHQAAYRGSTYACLTLLAAFVGSLFDFNSQPFKH
jgi:hypothetical protein